MKTFAYQFLVVLFGALVLFPGHVLAQDQGADELIQRLESRYNTLSAVKAEFTQTMSSVYSDRTESFSGTLLLQGNRYRVETDRQTLVTNGSVTWVYNADENQVLINENVADEDGFAIEHLFSDYSNRFRVAKVTNERLSGHRHHVLHLTPRDAASFFSQVTVWMRADDAIISRIEVVDENETKMLFDLKNVDLAPALDASSFTFSPPAGAEVIDLRS